MNAIATSGIRWLQPTTLWVPRTTLASARLDRLYFAQVREDARLEIEALAPAAHDRIVVVSSAGCTALSLLAAGAGSVIGVDMNRAQNHLVELKLAAVSRLDHDDALAFLGAAPATAHMRAWSYQRVRSALSPQARVYWNGHPAAIARGVLNAGVTERFIRLVVAALHVAVHPRRRTAALLSCATLAGQQALFDREWNSRRWRAFFHVLLNRAVMGRAYDPAFFAHLREPSFAAHFLDRANYSVRHLPVADNYFLHHMLSGRYPSGVTGGVPLYLDPSSRDPIVQRASQLSLVDGGMTEYLATLPPRSVSGFVLSNICEWLAPADIERLFAQIIRVAAPDARVCFRNFVGWTEVPARYRHIVVEDRARGEALMARDRSIVQRRFAVCRVQQGEWS
jgi:S-adenosylmethionine-diacylglycerol 3-amino-3-carboxypropyl transferase